ncbi:glucuronate isomerase [Chitinophaga terrae (ex Kim and Jung 2007)]|uniref:glucuronate isomerase n=1 Tax=Chitinophaga terrae (ex Kim and Jung 2007) TaxID=408074 RepID=UPI002784C665|nr:glucuronate isomerase [Chitinophaga terrae (ex Kim and Jung 2007)]MDQ0107674.1 glucuronate isomerase [Chitinophaga terrae (ex Kim and Jung 2007)]
MKQFLSEDFLLQTETAKRLYFDYAANMPIIDYHNHLPPDQIAENKTFANLYEIWLKGDHYKWRAMRANGVAEEYITGNADDYTKFRHWAATTPYTMRNPLYHWTHMELRNPFGVTELLSEKTAEKIYNDCNAQLPQFTTQRLLQHFKVEALCTTDDPVDDLSHHQHIANKPFGVSVFPTFRPDRAMAVDNPAVFNQFTDQLSAVANTSIESFEQLLEALKGRHDHFHAAGCRLSDHGLNTFYFANASSQELNNIFRNARNQQAANPLENAQFKTAVLLAVAEWNHQAGWAQQFHVGAIRNNNSRLLSRLGADAGVDSIGDWQVAEAMSRFFDTLDKKERLAKTIVYNLNPAYNEVFATMAGNFQDGEVPGKIQFGSGWWFLDQKDGMEKQMNALSNMGLLSRFVGMLTDSRSFLSYSRHEYFRRILCNLIGTDVEEGELPNDVAWLGKMVQDICYYNAKAYFEF